VGAGNREEPIEPRLRRKSTCSADSSKGKTNMMLEATEGFKVLLKQGYTHEEARAFFEEQCDHKWKYSDSRDVFVCLNCWAVDSAD
jgi:hypothetical protein